MIIAMGDETRATIINDKGEEYYEKWISLPVDQRYTIDLVVSYGMVWQKRALEHSYSPRSDHACVVSIYIKRITDCVLTVKNVSSNQRMTRERGEIVRMRKMKREMEEEAGMP